MGLFHVTVVLHSRYSRLSRPLAEAMGASLVQLRAFRS